MGSSPSCAIYIDGLGIQPETCSLVCNNGLTVGFNVTVDENKTCGKLQFHRVRSSAWCGAAALFSLPHGLAAPFKVDGDLCSRMEWLRCRRNELVVGTRKVRSKDRLRYLVHVLQLFVPQGRQEPHDARITKLVDDLALDSNGGHTLAKEYAAHLKERIGSELAVSVFSALQEI